MITIEYDDGVPAKKRPKNKPPEQFCTPRERDRGFYAVLPNGESRRIPIGCMRVGEMKALRDLINSLSPVVE